MYTHIHICEKCGGRGWGLHRELCGADTWGDLVGCVNSKNFPKALFL